MNTVFAHYIVFVHWVREEIHLLFGFNKFLYECKIVLHYHYIICRTVGVDDRDRARAGIFGAHIARYRSKCRDLVRNIVGCAKFLCAASYFSSQAFKRASRASSLTRGAA